MSDAANAGGQITAFYGYKGGSGRSFACANVAYALAEGLNRKVLVIDFDLEAPGVGDFFYSLERRVEQAWRRTPGILELVDRLGGAPSEEALLRALGDNFWMPQPAATFDAPDRAEAPFLLTVCRSQKGEGRLDLLGPGQIDDPNYASMVMDADWKELFDSNGERFFDYFANALRAHYDHVLIDLRTGFSMASARAAAAMMNRLVVFATPMHQSVVGAADMKRWMVAKLAERGRSVPTISVLSRIDPSKTSRAGELFEYRLDPEVKVAGAGADLDLPQVASAQIEHLVWERRAVGDKTPGLAALARGLEALAVGIDGKGESLPPEWWGMMETSVRTAFRKEGSEASTREKPTAETLLKKTRLFLEDPNAIVTNVAEERQGVERLPAGLLADFGDLPLLEASIFKEKLRRTDFWQRLQSTWPALAKQFGADFSDAWRIPEEPKPPSTSDLAQSGRWREILEPHLDRPRDINWFAAMALDLREMGRYLAADEDLGWAVAGLDGARTLNAVAKALVKDIDLRLEVEPDPAQRVDLRDARLDFAPLAAEAVRAYLSPAAREDLRHVIRSELKASEVVGTTAGLWGHAKAASNAHARATFLLDANASLEDVALAEEAMAAVDLIIRALDQPPWPSWDRLAAGTWLDTAFTTYDDLGVGFRSQLSACIQAVWRAGVLSSQDYAQRVAYQQSFCMANVRLDRMDVAVSTVHGMIDDANEQPGGTVRIGDLKLLLAICEFVGGKLDPASTFLEAIEDGSELDVRYRTGVAAWRAASRRMRGDNLGALADANRRLAAMTTSRLSGVPPEMQLSSVELEATILRLVGGDAQAARAGLERAFAGGQPRPGPTSLHAHGMRTEAALWYAAIGDHDVSIALKALEAFLADEGQCKDRFDPSTPTRVRRELAAFGALLAVDVEPELCGELSDKVLRWGSIKGRHPFETWAPEFQARLARAALSDSSSDLEAAVNCARAFIGGLHPADRSAAAAQIVAESRIYAGSRSSGRVALTLDRLASRLKG